jgi:hypothetical protein
VNTTLREEPQDQVRQNIDKLLAILIAMKGRMVQFFERMSAGYRRQFSRFLLSIILLLLMSTPVESTCLDDALATLDADTLIMVSTSVYRLLDDRRAVVFWLPLSKVTICDEVGNVGDEMALYYEIRNHDQNQMVRAMRER